MATLPEGIAFPENLSFESEPGRTWYIDQKTQRIVGECDGYIACRQAVEIILRTERYKWLIYLPSSGTEYEDLIGLDPGYVMVEIQRRIKDALFMDSRIVDVTDWAFKVSAESLTMSFVVRTVFGDIEETMEVEL